MEIVSGLMTGASFGLRVGFGSCDSRAGALFQAAGVLSRSRRRFQKSSVITGPKLGTWDGEVKWGRGGAPHFQMLLPLPGNPNSVHIWSIFSITASLMRISRPQSRLVSGGHLVVASKPILEPRPDSGEAKSR